MIRTRTYEAYTVLFNKKQDAKAVYESLEAVLARRGRVCARVMNKALRLMLLRRSLDRPAVCIHQAALVAFVAERLERVRSKEGVWEDGFV